MDDEVRLKPKRELPAKGDSGSKRLIVALDDEPRQPSASPPRIDLTDVFRAPEGARTTSGAIHLARRRLHVTVDPEPPRRVIRIGTSDVCDVKFDHPFVSPVHAEVRPTRGGTEILDRSRGGSGVTVNGRFVRRIQVRDGDLIGVGPYHYRLSGEQLLPRPEASGARLVAQGASYRVGHNVILQPTWLTIEPGELVAIIGQSGAGKSTLIKVLCGIHHAPAGSVLIDSEDVRLRQSEIGYVPQDDIVHGNLSFREALRYAAELRLPQDAERRQRHQAVDEVLREVGFANMRDRRVARLSGGERKRVGVAAELVSRPRLMCLDEPTTGLDPGLEQQMMQLFKDLCVSGRTVVLVTHTTKNLRLADRLIVMAPGGFLAFCGRPHDALAFFGVNQFDDIYSKLTDEQSAQRWHARYRELPSVRREWGHTSRRPASVGRPPRRRALPQIWTLTRRYARLFARDKRAVITLAVQAPVFGLLAGLLFKTDVFVHGSRPGSTREATQSAQLAFFLVTIAVWFGAIAASREIVKEQAVFRRESAVGVRVGSYLWSKALVLVPVVTMLVVVLCAVVFKLRDPHEPFATVATFTTILIATAVAGLASGLIISAWARSEDQATSTIPALLLPQLLLAGAIVPVAVMSGAMKGLSYVVFARWAYQGGGSALHMRERMQTDPSYGGTSSVRADFFDLSSSATILILLAFTAVAFGLVGWRLRTTNDAARR